MRTTLFALIGATLLFAGCTKETDDTSGDTEETGAEDTNTDDTGEVDAYVFATDDPSAYTRVDRAGFPAVNTALISSKDAYNAADPADDIAGTFVGEIVASLEFLHGALDDDLAAAGLTPCAVMDCVAAGGPLIVPDTLTLDVTQPTGFPNGRGLDAPVIDVTLAVLLLDLTVHSPTDLVGLNPTANDVPFDDAFPYLAAPH
jgi:hypothetical protein